MHDDCGRRRHFFGKRSELFVLAGRWMPKRASGRNGTDLAVLEHAYFSAVAGFLMGSFVTMVSPEVTSGFAERE
jgi:hypothetical protein